ncbi:MAG: hypothetical protein ACTSQF_00145 [Candidatus Heimdallarchaeaceae archaeon]
MQPKKLDHISVKDDHEIFGTPRDAGTTVYDKNDKKTYLLLSVTLSWECLASFDSKKELVKITGIIIELTVGQELGSSWGFKDGDYGSIDPDNIEGLVIIQLASASEIFRLIFFGNVKYDNNDTLNLEFEGYSNNPVLVTWEEEYYTKSDEDLDNWLSSNNGNIIDIIISIP